MTVFFKKLVVLLVAVVIIGYVFEWVFTYMHKNFAPRNKVDYLMQLHTDDSLDYAVFGSSRVFHFVDINLIEKETGKKGFNFGVPSASVFEIKLFVENAIRNKLTRNIFVQIDYIWNETSPDGMATTNWLPYIREKEVWEEFEYVAKEKYFYYKTIPYYRYARFDGKIGFREMLLSLSGKKMDGLSRRGYEPLNNVMKDATLTKDYELNKNMNFHIRDLIRMAKQNNVNLIFFTSPIYNFKGDNSVLSANLPNYTDFSNAIPDYKLYRDNTHLNKPGSKLFTEMFIDTYFNK